MGLSSEAVMLPYLLDEILLPLYRMLSRQTKSQDCMRHYILCIAYYIDCTHESRTQIRHFKECNQWLLQVIQIKYTLVSLNQKYLPTRGCCSSQNSQDTLNKFSVINPGTTLWLGNQGSGSYADLQQLNICFGTHKVKDFKFMVSHNNHDFSLFYILLAFLQTTFIPEHIKHCCFFLLLFLFYFDLTLLPMQNYFDTFVCFPFSYLLYNKRIKTGKISYPFFCHSK